MLSTEVLWGRCRQVLTGCGRAPVLEEVSLVEEGKNINVLFLGGAVLGQVAGSLRDQRRVVVMPKMQRGRGEDEFELFVVEVLVFKMAWWFNSVVFYKQQSDVEQLDFFA